MNIILVCALIAVGIATIATCIDIAVAQTNQNMPFAPSTGHVPSTLSPPSSPSPQSSPSPHSSLSTSSNVGQPTNANSRASGNNTIIGPPRIIIVGPSDFIASPITSENQVNTNASSTPSKNSSSLGNQSR